MSVYEKFTSNQNKGMVWKLMCDDGVFKSISDDKASQVKNEFDRKIETIARQITPNDTMINLDKRVIAEMLNDMKNYIKKEDPLPVFNAADLLQKRQKIFQDELKNKQKDFDSFNNVPTPEKIDFSDNLDSPMGGEMDKILAAQIALREKQLKMVLETQDKEAATKWIQNPSEVNKPEVNKPEKLKIGENISIKEPLKVKKVNFSDTNENSNFMTLLKKKEIDVVSPPPLPADDTTILLLREILNKQNQILDLLIPKN